MPLHLIYAQSRNRVIGNKGQLPWHLPEDLAHFKKTTTGRPVIMGRNTWESLPAQYRPLPGRRNIVVSRDPDFTVPEGVSLARSLLEAAQLVPMGANAFVIGGARLYEAALPVAASVVVTEIDIDVEGDTFAPVLGKNWMEKSREAHIAADGTRYAIVQYARRVPLHKDPDQDARFTPFDDRGPWVADVSGENGRERVFIESYSSGTVGDDVRLYVDGNFGGVVEKLDYARGLADHLNKSLGADISRLPSGRS